MSRKSTISSRKPQIVKSASRISQEVTKLIEDGLAEHRAGRINQAKTIYEEIYKKDPNNFDTLQLLGAANAQQKNWEAALQYLNKASQINNINAAVFNNQGYVLKELKKFDEALKSYDQAIHLKPDYAEAFNNRGIVLKELQQFDEALKSYDQAIHLKPDYAEAFNNRGNVLKELKKFDEALKSYDQAIYLKPDYAGLLLNRGIVLKELQQFDEALKSYDQAIYLKPDYAEAFNNRGNVLKELKKFDEALKSYDQAIHLKPDYAEAFNNRGNVLKELKKFDEALKSYDQAIYLKPDYAGLLLNRGIVLKELQQFDEALKSYDQAIHLKPDYAEAFNNRGNVLKELKKFDEALKSYDQTIHLKPDYAEAFNNRGIVLKELQQFDEALKSYDQAIYLKPDYAEAFNNRGNVLKELKKFDEALKSYDQAIHLKPDYAEAFYNRGIVLKELQQFDEALKSYDQAIYLKPDYAEALNNRGLLRLLLRDFRQGFIDYRRRFQINGFKSKPLKTTLPSCEDVGLKGRVLLWAEQGIGDEIFYAGLLPMLDKSVLVTVSADKRLHSIYKRSFPTIDILDKDILFESTVTARFDAHAPIGDLGYYLGIDHETIRETRIPYLKSNITRRDEFRNKNSVFGSGLVCGVAWKSYNQELGPDKSIDLTSFEPILRLPSIQFVNLQYGDIKDDIEQVKSKYSVNIHQVPDLDIFQDLDGLLALIDACDVIVTTSNVTAHLAGALGKRSAVLVPFGGKGKIWYWHHNDENSFWYPNIKLFYQDNPLDWSGSIKDCADWMMQLYG